MVSNGRLEKYDFLEIWVKLRERIVEVHISDKQLNSYGKK